MEKNNDRKANNTKILTITVSKPAHNNKKTMEKNNDRKANNRKILTRTLTLNPVKVAVVLDPLSVTIVRNSRGSST